jgi:hypothetical protein
MGLDADEIENALETYGQYETEHHIALDQEW